MVGKPPKQAAIFVKLNAQQKFLVFQDIADKVVVLGECREVVVPAAVDPDQRDFSWIERLQLFTVTNWNQPVICTMKYVGMAVHPGQPFVSTHVKTQHEPQWKHR